MPERLIGWEAKRNIAQMCTDAWNWQRRNAMLNLEFTRPSTWWPCAL